jgi:arylsulfatase A
VSCLIRTSVIALLVGLVTPVSVHAQPPTKSSPNFVVIYCDNLGYGDVGCFGSTKHRTPHIDRMAAEGMKLTSFYSTSGVCTPSRASLITACYPRRVGLDLTDPDGAVLRPVSPNGLHPDEMTIAEVLKQKGYATACIGKWHLGDQPEFLPTRQGFDEFYGIPYSDDMTPRTGKPWPPLPLMENEKVIEAPTDRNTLTKRYTEQTIRFIEQHATEPFFIYLPHAMPGSTRRPFASKAFQGKSANGPYGDCIEELDWSTGEILSALKRLKLDDNTLVVWTSDNGAPRRDPPQGSNLPLGGWGYSTSEGGQRVPCVVRWPGRIPPGTICTEITSTMDLLPTLAGLAGAALPTKKIDGHNILDLLINKPGAKSPYKAFYYYYRDQLQAVRSENWKLHLALPDRQANLSGKTKPSASQLFNLTTDVAEQANLAAAHPDVVERLEALAELMRQDLGDGDRIGANERPIGRNEQPTARDLTVSPGAQ